LVPGYWSGIRHNSTSLVLTLREILQDRDEAVQFLRSVQRFPKGIVGALRELQNDTRELSKARHEVLEALRRCNDEGDALLAS
ncbi:MAG: hypothetical protein ACHQ9S_26895, partial [Candidatus Binatia bacterium]